MTTEGLLQRSMSMKFPFLFGGTFIEGTRRTAHLFLRFRFPFLFGGTFIEGAQMRANVLVGADFPSFSEGLSLRGISVVKKEEPKEEISLPFRRDFH